MSDLRSEFRQEVSSLLPRLRQTIVFPPVKERLVLASIGRLPPSLPPPRQHNMQLAFRWDNIVHYTLQRMGGGIVPFDVDQVFWCRYEKDVMAPQSRASAFGLDEKFRHNPLLREWFKDATALEAYITKATFKLYQIAGLLTHRRQVAALWPEISGAVPGFAAFRPATEARLAIVSRSMTSTFNHILPHKDREELVSKLAVATLLPRNTALCAWPGMYKESEYG